ncbi:MAG: carboxypeptidase-like regulatory domain-containing protein [Actinomycetia bacterium]|nr:carboxypeptidase-like regulatory domain-containing protein [Actinomycetes bacterium]
MPQQLRLSAISLIGFSAVALVAPLAPAASAAMTPAPSGAAAAPSGAPDAGLVRGKVESTAGKPISGVRVTAYVGGSRPGRSAPVGTAITSQSGKYRISGLPRGGYRILADGYPKLREARWQGGGAKWKSGQKTKLRNGQKKGGLSVRLGRLAGSVPSHVVPTPKPKKPALIANTAVDAIQPYQGQTRCWEQAQPGTVGLRDLIFATYGDEIPAGLNRACLSDVSEHYDGRAIDWMVNSRDFVQASQGDRLVNWLTATRKGEPGAMARRLGVMYIVWRGHSWGQYRMAEGWRPYRDCQTKSYRGAEHDNICHRNHIHISLNKAGAKKLTSWWSGQPLP